MAITTRKVHGDLRKILDKKVGTLLEQMENASLFERDITTLLGIVRAAKEVASRLERAERQLEDATLQGKAGGDKAATDDRIAEITAHRDALVAQLSQFNAGLKTG